MRGRQWTPPPTRADKVLDVALRLFDAVGYSATTIEDIRLQSEVSIGSIYHHFGNKEGIAGRLYVDSLTAFQQGLLQAVRSRGAEDGVRAGVEHQLRWMAENPARARFLMRRRETELAEVTTRDVALLNRRLFAELADWHRPLAIAGELGEIPMSLLVAVWFGPAQEYGRQVLGTSDRSVRKRLNEAEPILGRAAWESLRSSR